MPKPPQLRLARPRFVAIGFVGAGIVAAAACSFPEVTFGSDDASTADGDASTDASDGDGDGNIVRSDATSRDAGDGADARDAAEL